MNIDFFLTDFIAKKIVAWKCRGDKSTNGRYGKILGRGLLTILGLDLKFPKDVIIGGEGLYKGCLSPMVDVRNCDFKYITDKIIEPEESFVNLYVDECL